MGFFATIDKYATVAVLSDVNCDANRLFIKDSETNRFISASGVKPRSLIVTAKSENTVCYGTKLSARALERKLNTKYYLNI